MSTSASNSEADGPHDNPSADPMGRLEVVPDNISERVDDEHDIVTSTNDLNMWQGAALLTADCLGTGILALPEDIAVLGKWFGLGFLILNLPINLYAGTILSHAADHIEDSANIHDEAVLDGDDENIHIDEDDNFNEQRTREGQESSPTNGATTKGKRIQTYNTIPGEDEFHDEPGVEAHVHPSSKDISTFDFIGMAKILFQEQRQISFWIMILFYTNIFLVLGDYILVMSHAVVAMLGAEREDGSNTICIPTAGLIASTAMFAVAQIRTMAKLGRTATMVSLAALLIVLVQCVIANERQKILTPTHAEEPREEASILRKLAAMGSIGFATGSQKLFLNIRHELSDRKTGPKTLGVSLSVFGTAYVAICLLAGNNPPGFLFDAIPPGWGRRIAGFLMWGHVVVSFAINSQAICASMDRIFFHKVEFMNIGHLEDHQRWMILTAIMAVTAFFVANAVPFFKDLVSLIGALTSIPLTLLLPALYHRKVVEVPLWKPTWNSIPSYTLLVYSVGFVILGLAGSIDSIGVDWENRTGGFFACDG